MAYNFMKKSTYFYLFGAFLGASISMTWGLLSYDTLQNIHKNHTQWFEKWQTQKTHALKRVAQAQAVHDNEGALTSLFKKEFLPPPTMATLKHHLEKHAQQHHISLKRLDLKSEEKEGIIIFHALFEGEMYPDMPFYEWIKNLESQNVGLLLIQQLHIGRARLSDEITPTDFSMTVDFYFFNDRETL